MGRDDAVNVEITREQIYPHSTREHITLAIKVSRKIKKVDIGSKIKIQTMSQKQ